MVPKAYGADIDPDYLHAYAVPLPEGFRASIMEPARRG